jgi:hypothetical protein
LVGNSDVLRQLPDVEVSVIVKLLAIGSLICALVLFLILGAYYGSGGPLVTETQIEWVNDGSVVRRMTPMEYWRYTADTVMMTAAFSGALAFGGAWLGRVVAARDRFIREEYPAK